MNKINLKNLIFKHWENDTKSWLEKSDGFAFVNWSGAVKQRPVFKFIEFDDDYMTLHQSKSIVKRVDKDSKGSAGAFEDNFVIKGFQNLGQHSNNFAEWWALCSIIAVICLLKLYETHKRIIILRRLKNY